MEATECGAASLGIILAYFGRYVPLEELRVECRVSRDGSNALYVKKTGEKHGLIGRGYQMTVEQLHELKPPFMVFWDLNHFLVVEGFGLGRVYLSDPATGRRVVDEKTFRASYTGIVFRFEPGPNFKKGGDKPSTIRAIYRRMRGARTAVTYVVLAGVALLVCELVTATFNLIFVDQVMIEERWQWIRPLLMAMTLTALFRVVVGVVQQCALRSLKLSLAMVHSAKFLWHLLRLPIPFYQQRFAGEVSGRMESNSLAADVISGQLATTMVGFLMVVFYAAVMFEFDWLLTLVGVMIGCLNLAAIWVASRLLADENLKIKQVRGRLHGSMMRAIQIIETIKAGSSEAEMLVRLSGQQARVTNAAQVVGAASALLIVLPPFFLLLTTAAVLFLGGGQVIEGLMSVGALLAFQTLMVSFNRPFGDLVRLGSSVQSLQAELSRLDDVYQYPPDPLLDPPPADSNENERTAPPAREPPRRLSGHLELRDVTFGYNHTIDEPLIKHFSLKILPGSRVALVGASGSGKSTIGRLVAGLYRPWEGQVLYDGLPIEEVPRAVFTSQVAVVDDQAFLFSGTVRDNLTFWDDTIPQRDLVRAAIDAGIHRDLIQRRGGYHAGLVEGARNFSGGQRQRLEIARALIRSPSLLVLDEATSALDPVTEALVDDNLRRRGCTCLIIAHRLSTIRDCDEIVVLRQGRVVQRGTHDQLMAVAGPYRELQTLQAPGALSVPREGETPVEPAQVPPAPIRSPREGEAPAEAGAASPAPTGSAGASPSQATPSPENGTPPERDDDTDHSPTPTNGRDDENGRALATAGDDSPGLLIPASESPTTNGQPGAGDNGSECSETPHRLGPVDNGGDLTAPDLSRREASVVSPAHAASALRSTHGALEAAEPGGDYLQASGAELEREPVATASREAVDLLKALEPCGEIVITSGNLPLALDDCGSVWHIVSGQVDVFYEQPEPGQERGSRRHLFRVEDGGTLFAVAGDRDQEQGGLLAVGVGPAQLLRFPSAELSRLGREPRWRRGVAELIDEWIERISRATDPGGAPIGGLRLEAGYAGRVEAEQSVFARGGVVWVCPSGKDLRFFGRVRVSACDRASHFPLSPHSWLSFAMADELAAWDTPTLIENGDVWGGLNRFHRAVLGAISHARTHERAIRQARLESSALREEEMVATALGGLLSLARPDAPAAIVPSRGELLLEACRIVGRAAGIDVKPAPIDAVGEPLWLISRASGFRTRRVQLGIDWWQSDCGPILGFLSEDGRPVALLPAAPRAYTLCDPALGVRIDVTEDVARRLSPVAVMFYRTLPAARQAAGDLVRFSLPIVRRELRTILLMGAASGLLGLVAPAVTGVVIDDAIPRADHWRLGLLCAFLIAVGAAIATFQAIQGLALVRIKGRLESTLLPAVWERLLNLPARFFSEHEAGDLALRALGLARLIETLASTSIASVILGTFSLVNLVILFYFNWKLALLGIGLLVIAAAVFLVFLPALWRTQRSIARAQGKISGLLLVLLGGIERLRVAGAEKRAFARWAEQYKLQLELMTRFQKFSDRLIIFGDVWPLVILMLVFLAVVGLGPPALSTGDFLAFHLALMQGVAAVIGLGKGLLPLLGGLEQYERFRPILDAAPESSEVSGEAVVLGGSIRLTNVSFRYDSDGPLILDSVSLQVRPGEFVAVVGPSGSGKSTLLRLLLGFEAPLEGVIAYDGRELFTLDIQEVRRQIGVVLQGAELFPGDLYSNIVGLSSHMTEADAWESAELAGVADDIANMPMGIHTVVGEGGGGLSSGQRQRLIIARALAGKPKILLLDEATSALDNQSQAVVSKSIHSKLAGTTRLAIAHRVSTVIDADRIYVLHEGKIVQNGRYSDLIQEKGPFRELARRQLLA
jgi:NHLM bacteriocin system ABC transporter peptidase/ATP-binding protein/NHLM bacteriocin system ABC transporter ATP-binding protein